MIKTIQKMHSAKVSVEDQLESNEELKQGLLALDPQAFKTFFELSGAKVTAVRI